VQRHAAAEAELSVAPCAPTIPANGLSLSETDYRPIEEWELAIAGTLTVEPPKDGHPLLSISEPRRDPLPPHRFTRRALGEQYGIRVGGRLHHARGRQ